MIAKDTNILIVGLGLIGGSYAKALKNQGFKVCAITKEQSSIDYAIENSIIDYGTTEIDENLIKQSKLIIFSLYPHIFKEWIKENQKYFSKGTIITDVTGIKQDIVNFIQPILREDVEFIAAHPMAGREVYGVENSTPDMFKGANYIVVPTEKNTEYAIEYCKELGKLLGFAKISVISPKEHDMMIGFLSQLTHCIAIALMTCNDDPTLADYTGDSFRDLTRIARINENMWSELFSINKKALTENIDCFVSELTKIKNMILLDETEDLKDIMRLSTKRRKLFDRRK